MKSKFVWKITAASLFSALAFFAFACKNEPPTPTSETLPTVNASSPTEAYKYLYAAVKSKETPKIKAILSKGSLGFAGFAAAQQKKPLDKFLENGFTATTFAETLPEMRDERVKENFGAVEVWNAKDKKWEDLPFVLEDGSWKFAIGDHFGGKWTSPGDGLAKLEEQIANTTGNNMILVNPANNANTSSNVNPLNKPANANSINKPAVVKPLLKNKIPQ